MTAIRRLSVLGLALLLAAATALADTVITAEDVIPCSIELADVSFLSLRLPQGSARILNTRDIYEIRIRDSSRVTDIAARLPQVRVRLDWGQAIPPRVVRAREMTRLRLKQAREALARGFSRSAEVVDTLPRRTSPSEMTERSSCMEVALRECGRSDETVAELLREVHREEQALRRLWLRWATCLYVPGGGLLGGLVGAVTGIASTASKGQWEQLSGVVVGCGIGGAIGAAIGTPIGVAHHRGILARHRNRVNDLICRINRTVATAP